MMNTKHIDFLRRCDRLQKQAKAKGNNPNGAVLVRQNEVILTAEDSVAEDGNVLHTAVYNLLHRAAEIFELSDVQQNTVYVWLEPTAFEYEILKLFRIESVVFGVNRSTQSENTGLEVSGPFQVN